LMGYIHSGVRQDWHFYMVIRDVSPRAQNPGLDEVGYIVALITIVYFCLVSFVFWLAHLATPVSEAASLAVGPDVGASDVEGAPSDEAPSRHDGSDDAPTDDAPSDDAPTDDAPSDDAPSDDAPSDDAPSDDAPSDDAPSDDEGDVSEPEDEVP